MSDIKPPAQKTAPGTTPSLEQVKEEFAQDKFATLMCGAQVDEAWPGHSVCSFEISESHRNGMGAVMGGAIFTLADFASAVASNAGQAPAMTVMSSIEFVSAAKGDRLIATCDADRSGRRLSYYTTRIKDDHGVLVAVVTSSFVRV